LEAALPGADRLMEKRAGASGPCREARPVRNRDKMGQSPKDNFVAFLKGIDRRDRAGEDVAKLMTTREVP
jgi:hypothetical protein